MKPVQGYISADATLSSRALVAPSVRIYGPTIIDDFVLLDHGVTIGYPSPSEQAEIQSSVRSHSSGPACSFDEMLDAQVDARTIVRAGTVIRSNTVIYSGTFIEESADIAHNVQVRENCSVGQCSMIVTGTQIMAGVTIGRGCRIAGTLCNRSQVGHGSSMLGHLMHTYRIGVPGIIEGSPQVGESVIVGRESAVVGEVCLDDFAIVGAGTVITSSIASGTIWAHNPATQIGMRRESEIDILRKRVDALQGLPLA